MDISTHGFSLSACPAFSFLTSLSSSASVLSKSFSLSFRFRPYSTSSSRYSKRTLFVSSSLGGRSGVGIRFSQAVSPAPPRIFYLRSNLDQYHIFQVLCTPTCPSISNHLILPVRTSRRPSVPPQPQVYPIPPGMFTHPSSLVINLSSCIAYHVPFVFVAALTPLVASSHRQLDVPLASTLTQAAYPFPPTQSTFASCVSKRGMV